MANASFRFVLIWSETACDPSLTPARLFWASPIASSTIVLLRLLHKYIRIYIHMYIYQDALMQASPCQPGTTRPVGQV